MGIFSRNKNNQTIQLNDKYTQSLIHPLSNRLSRIRLGEALNVREGWSVVIVTKGKAQEIFNAGQHQLTIASMPNTSTALGLNNGKVKKRNQNVQMVMPENFDCDLYFVNLQQFDNIPWETGKICIRSKRYGLYRVKLSGSLSIQVTRPLDFINLFLYQWSHIPQGKDKKYLSALIDEACQLLLTKSDFSDPNDFLNNQKMSAYLTENLNKHFSKYGFNIQNVNVTANNITGRVATMLQSEQNGDSGLTKLVEQQIDEIGTNLTPVTANVSIPLDTTIENEEPAQPTPQFVYAGRHKPDTAQANASAITPTHTADTDITSPISLTPPNQSILPDLPTEPTQPELPELKLSSILQLDDDVAPTNSKNNKNIDKLLRGKQQLSNSPTANVTQNTTQTDYLQTQDQPRTINLTDDITCPKCGSIMLGGHCINCQQKKDKTE